MSTSISCALRIRSARFPSSASWKVADDDKTAEAYALDAKSPYRFYYSQLYAKLKRGRLDLFSGRVLALPPVRPVAAYETVLDGDEVRVNLEGAR